MVYASPLTRATQTCLLCLAGHPALRGDGANGVPGLTLLSASREKKNLGGQDTVGDKVSATQRLRRALHVPCVQCERREVTREGGRKGGSAFHGTFHASQT